MMRMFFLLAPAMMLFLAACSPPGVEEAHSDFCQALDNYREAAAQVSGINAETTVAELGTMRDEVADAREELLSATGTLREARVRYAEDAWKQLEEEMGGIPAEATLGAAAPMVRERVELLLTEIDRANNVSCERR